MEQIISNKVRDDFFKSVFLELSRKANQKKELLTREWAKNNFPSKPGVYCFFESGNLVYVGESGNLCERMKDMLNTKNHNLRRLIGESKFSKHKGYKKASSKQSYSEEIEVKLVEWIKNSLTVSSVPIHIGRKEFEDWVQATNPEIKFLNKPKKRK